jgi:hypothetical protein
MSIHHVDRGTVLHINIEEKIQSAARVENVRPLLAGSSVLTR